MKAFGKIINGKLILNNERSFKDKLIEFEGKEVEIRIKLRSNNRSKEQNSLYWKWINILSNETGFQVEEMHELVKYKFLQRNVVNNDGVEEIDITKYIGGGLLFTLAAGGAGYYFIGRGVKDEIESIVAEVVEEKTINFTEINDEFLCNACGAMFPITDGKSCPSCGLLED